MWYVKKKNSAVLFTLLAHKIAKYYEINYTFSADKLLSLQIFI